MTLDASATQPGTPLHLQFDDNRLLPLLFGQHDQNLANDGQRVGRVGAHAIDRGAAEQHEREQQTGTQIFH